MRSATLLASLAALAFAAVALAGCGGSSTSASALPTTASGGPATLGVASTGLGNIVVNAKGRSLYLFAKDSGSQSACLGACAANWPPLRAGGKPTIGSGLKSSLVGLTMRSDGASQVTYNGHPVYLFVGDKSAGQTSGQGVNAFGGSWYVLSPAGDQITTSVSTGGGNGY
jgi:predicted lipoprotein with Yx(FWY)xxD motif